MKMRLVLLAATALLITSCNTGTQNADETSSEADAGSASIADEDAIRAQVVLWHELIKSKDAAGIAQLYTEDGAVMPPNATIGKGQTAIEQTWAALVNTPGFELSIVPEEIVISASGDMAMDRGTFQLAMAPAGEVLNDTGKYVVVWLKVDGEWKAAADIFNSDLPAGGG